jgi:hypothetical protein
MIQNKEQRLREMFSEVHKREDEVEFMNVEFGEDGVVYQYIPGYHHTTGLNEDMFDTMMDVVEKHDLVVESSSTDSSLLMDFASMVTRFVLREKPHSDTEWITAGPREPESADDTYAVFIDICEIVFGYDLSDVTDVVIVAGDEISWTDL